MQGRHKSKKQALRKKKITMLHRHVLVERLCNGMSNLIAKVIVPPNFPYNSSIKILFVSNNIIIYCNDKSNGLVVYIKNENYLSERKGPMFGFDRDQHTNIGIVFEFTTMIIGKFGIGYKEDVLLNIIYSYASKISKAKTHENIVLLIKELHTKEKEFRLKVFDKTHSGVK